MANQQEEAGIGWFRMRDKESNRLREGGEVEVALMDYFSCSVGFGLLVQGGANTSVSHGTRRLIDWCRQFGREDDNSLLLLNIKKRRRDKQDEPNINHWH